MKHKKLIAFILAFLPLAASAQEERIDTVIPKFLSNGYFFREMPQLPDGEKSILRLKDKEGNSVVVINVNATLPKSLIRKAIPREQVHNADQFLNGINMMATMRELTHDPFYELIDKQWTFLLNSKDRTPSIHSFELYAGQSGFRDGVIYILPRGRAKGFPVDRYTYITSENIFGTAPHIRNADRTDQELINALIIYPLPRKIIFIVQIIGKVIYRQDRVFLEELAVISDFF